jgi:hypothetical protein
MIATGKCWRVMVPTTIATKEGRHYLFAWNQGELVKNLRGLVAALSQFGFLNQAEVLIADAEAGVLRRPIFGRAAMETNQRLAA